MATRKIAECLNVRINVGNYQHIDLTKYAEEEIEYSSNAELVKKEDSLRDDLIASLVRSMKEIPSRLGKGVEQAQVVEESIKKAIPGWLVNNPIPNIANVAVERHLSNVADQKDNKDQAKDNLSLIEKDEPSKSTKVDIKKEEPVKEAPVKEAPVKKAIAIDTEDLFENDAPVDVKEENKKKSSDDEFFDEEDEDLFGD